MQSRITRGSWETVEKKRAKALGMPTPGPARVELRKKNHHLQGCPKEGQVKKRDKMERGLKVFVKFGNRETCGLG